MYLCYFDESGDDGYPDYSSDFFVLTSIYLHNLNWQTNYSKIYKFRKQLKDDYNFPIKLEFHLKYFLTDKSPYRALDYSSEQKRQILGLFFDLISMLEIKIINIVINKNNIKTDDYDVLDKALTYNIQRIENDLKSIDPTHRFLIITDEGRVGKMVKTTRKIQKINYIPSKIFTSPYRNEIEKLIEDPLPKRSDESFFIQIADTISYIVQLYSLSHFKEGKWANRVLSVLNYGDEIKLLNKIKNVLNTKASASNEFGIVHYPK